MYWIKAYAIFILMLCGCDLMEKSTSTESAEGNDPVMTGDTSMISIIEYDTSRHERFIAGKPARLTIEDLNEVDELIQNCLESYHTQMLSSIESLEDTAVWLIQLGEYKRQYLPVLNHKGEKVVWVNCFCNSWNIDWKREILEVLDGGKCYFNLKVNLDQDICYEMMVNGEA